MTAREAIIAYLKTALTNAGFKLVTRRALTVKQVALEEFPAVILAGGSENCRTISINAHSAEGNWELDLTVMVLAEPEADAQDELDAKVALAIRTITATDTLGGTAMDCEVVRKVPDPRVYAPFGACTIKAIVQYRYNEVTQGG